MRQHPKTLPFFRALATRKGRRLAKLLGKEAFKATGGWFHRMRKRSGTKQKKLHREAQAVDLEASAKFVKEVWPQIISEYSPSATYNADKTGLFFRDFPNYTLTFEDDVKKVKKKGWKGKLSFFAA
jgi:hypothetical protein